MDVHQVSQDDASKEKSRKKKRKEIKLDGKDKEIESKKTKINFEVRRINILKENFKKTYKSKNIQNLKNLNRFKKNNSKKIEKHFKRNEEKEHLNKKDKEEILLNAKFLIDHEEYDLANCLLKAVLKNDPHDSDALHFVSLCFKALDQSYKIFFLLKKLIAVPSLQFKEALFYAHILSEHGWNEEAKKTYFRILDSKLREKKGDLKHLNSLEEKELFTLYKNLGDIHLKMSLMDEAEDHLNKALAINPLCDILWVSYGTLEWKKGDFEKALFYYRRAAIKNSENDAAWVGLALIHRAYGDFELSWANIERALDINPLNESTLNLATLWAYQDSKEDFLIKNLRESLQLDSMSEGSRDKKEELNIKIRLLLARILYDLGRYKHALEEIEAIIRIRKNCKGVLAMKYLLKESLQNQSYEHFSHQSA